MLIDQYKLCDLFIYYSFKSSLEYRVGTFSFQTALQWRPVGKKKRRRKFNDIEITLYGIRIK